MMEVSSPPAVEKESSVDLESRGSFDGSAAADKSNETALTKPTETKKERQQKRQRIGLFVFSALTATFYAGAFFSWGPMQLLLEAHGVFEDRCAEGEPTPCPAQTSTLLTVQFVASFALVASPLLGWIADRYGAVKLMYVTASFGLLGLGLLTLATGFHWDYVVFVAFFLIGIMAMSAAVNTVQVGMLFSDVTRQRVISALNTLFDAGLLTYLALWGIQRLVGCSLPALLLGYFAIGILCFAGSIHFWRVAVPVDCDAEQNASEEVEKMDAVTVSVESTEHLRTDTSSLNEEDTNVELNVKGEYETELETMEVGINTTEGDSIDAAKDSNVDDVDSTSDEKINDDYVLIADRPPMQQLRSKQFVTLTIFFSIHATRDVFNLTTARDFLAYLGDDETGNKYLTIYTLLAPASILGLPLLDFVLTRYGYHAGLQVVNALALGQGIIMVASENLNVQVLGFVFASLFRCFMYTISLGILPTFLGFNVVGKASGIMPCIAGLLSLVNIPMANWAVNDLDGNFFYPNLIYTILVIPCIYAAWVIGRGIKREDAAKERQQMKAR